MALRRNVKKWSANDINKLWEGSLAEVAKKLGRSVASISVARTAYSRFKPGNPTGMVATEDNISNAPAKKAAPKKASAKAASKKTASKKAAAPKPAQQLQNQGMANNRSNPGFRMTYGGQELTLDMAPKKLKISGDELEVEF